GESGNNTQSDAAKDVSAYVGLFSVFSDTELNVFAPRTAVAKDLSAPTTKKTNSAKQLTPRATYSDIVQRRRPSPSSTPVSNALPAAINAFGSSPLSSIDGFQPSSPRGGPAITGNLTFFQKSSKPIASSPLKQVAQPTEVSEVTPPLKEAPQVAATETHATTVQPEQTNPTSAIAIVDAPTGAVVLAENVAQSAIVETPSVTVKPVVAAQVSDVFTAQSADPSSLSARGKSSIEVMLSIKAKLQSQTAELSKPLKALQAPVDRGPPSSIVIPRATQPGSAVNLGPIQTMNPSLDIEEHSLPSKLGHLDLRTKLRSLQSSDPSGPSKSKSTSANDKGKSREDPSANLESESSSTNSDGPTKSNTPSRNRQKANRQKANRRRRREAETDIVSSPKSSSDDSDGDPESNTPSRNRRKANRQKANRKKRRAAESGQEQHDSSLIPPQAPQVFSHVEVPQRPSPSPKKIPPPTPTILPQPSQQVDVAGTEYTLGSPPGPAGASSPALSVSPVNSLRRVETPKTPVRRRQRPMKERSTVCIDTAELFEDWEYDFRWVTRGFLVSTALCHYTGDEEQDSTEWELWVPSLGQWRQCPPGWGPGPDRHAQMVRDIYPFAPTPDIEYVFLHRPNHTELVAFAGRLQRGEQDEFDRNTVVRHYNDRTAHPIPLGWQAPRIDLASASRVSDSVLAELRRCAAEVREELGNDDSDDDDDDDQDEDDQDEDDQDDQDEDDSDADTVSSYGQTSRQQKKEELRLSKQLNRAPPSTTSDEDEELNREFEESHRARRTLWTSAADPGRPTSSSNAGPIPSAPAEVTVDFGELLEAPIPERSAKSKGKAKATASQSPSPAETNDDEAAPLKGGRPSKEVTEGANKLRDTVWNLINQFRTDFPNTLSVNYLLRYLFNVAGSHVGKRNPWTTFMEFMGTFKDALPEVIVTPGGEVSEALNADAEEEEATEDLTPLESHKRKVQAAYKNSFLKLSEEERDGFLRRMEDKIIFAKGKPQSQHAMAAAKKATEHLKDIAQELHRHWGFNVVGALLPDSADPAVLAKAALFYGNPAVKDLLEEKRVPVREIMDQLTTMLKYQRIVGTGGATSGLFTFPPDDDDDFEKVNSPPTQPSEPVAGPSRTSNQPSKPSHTSTQPSQPIPGPSRKSKHQLDHSPSPEPKKRAKKTVKGDDDRNRGDRRHYISNFMARKISSIILGVPRARSIPYMHYLPALEEHQKVVLSWPVWTAVLGLGFDPVRLPGDEMVKFEDLIDKAVNAPFVRDWDAAWKALSRDDPNYQKIPLVTSKSGEILATTGDVAAAIELIGPTKYKLSKQPTNPRKRRHVDDDGNGDDEQNGDDDEGEHAPTPPLVAEETTPTQERGRTHQDEEERRRGDERHRDDGHQEREQEERADPAAAQVAMIVEGAEAMIVIATMTNVLFAIAVLPKVAAEGGVN
ncbi:hypothetical protein H0H93_002684, partial [Arthromyces matolae]